MASQKAEAKADKMVKIVKKRTGEVVASPQRRLVPFRVGGYYDRYDRVSSSGLEYFRVWFPWMKFSENSGSMYYGLKIEMSHNGKIWQPAWFPHVVNGSSMHCIQQGSWAGLNKDDPVTAIADYAGRYISGGIVPFWQPLFNKHMAKVPRPKTPGGFMELWEQCSLEEINEFLATTAKKLKEQKSAAPRRADYGY